MYYLSYLDTTEPMLKHPGLFNVYSAGGCAVIADIVSSNYWRWYPGYMLSQTEIVWRYLLTDAYEADNRSWPSATHIADELGFPLSTTARALQRPLSIGALVRGGTGRLILVNPGRLLVVWAGWRSIQKDMLHQVNLSCSAPLVEQCVADAGAIVGGFGAAVYAWGVNAVCMYDTPICYGDPMTILPALDKLEQDGYTSTLSILQPDALLARWAPRTPLSQAYVDLVNWPGWPAGKFIAALNDQLLEHNVA